MTLRSYKGIGPELAKSAWVDPSAQVIGPCHLAEDVSIWPCAVLRGDVSAIEIGARSNIQDGAVVHATHVSERTRGSMTRVGCDVTVGHNVVLHGCILEDECLIGMGAIVLDNAVVQKHVLVGANSLVPAGKVLDSGYLYLGSPVKQIRPLTDDEKAFFKYSAAHYVKLKNEFAAESSVVPVQSPI
ncbi:gamma carbonic anhydrase family protein [Thiomicrospira cyclica]|uniref:Hexapeptide repeat-containing transferase n=1 Tax=Thiomicrospira cyclica (strain DSM 14477 / JCM 11371 / ALM1) TaxID=717773 RepID=F6DB83_THICA|nr:gamma carbonic anhydrase family protein [Thiomicrospira cyclica]AEG30823.1 hexapeptide repeat-containing transferase [Thiomicrospira cyclica ALM1]